MNSVQHVNRFMLIRLLDKSSKLNFMYALWHVTCATSIKKIHCSETSKLLISGGFIILYLHLISYMLFARVGMKMTSPRPRWHVWRRAYWYRKWFQWPGIVFFWEMQHVWLIVMCQHFVETFCLILMSWGRFMLIE